MNQRLERVNQLIRDEIADLLRREIHDPLIGFVTITEVEVSPDLRHAKVFFSVLGDEKQVQDSIKGLLRARKYLNSRLAERIELRYIPKIRFVYDETAAKAQRMQETLRREREELAAKMAEHEAAEAAAREAGETPALPGEAEDVGDEDLQDEDWDDEDLEDEDFEDLDDEEDEDFEGDEDLEDEDFDEDEAER